MDLRWAAVVALLLTLLARAYWYYARFATTYFPRASVVDTPLRAGDLIFFVSNTHMYYNSLFTQDIFSHAGMVVEGPGGGLWLSESARGPPYAGLGQTGRAALSPLYNRLYHYPGSVVVQKVAPELPPRLKAQLWRLAQEDAPYPSAGYLVAGAVGVERALFRRPQRHCMAHVAWLVDELGLRPAADPRPLSACGVVSVCRAVTTMPGRGPSRSGHRYAPSVCLVYDAELLSWDAAGLWRAPSAPVSGAG